MTELKAETDIFHQAVLMKRHPMVSGLVDEDSLGLHEINQIGSASVREIGLTICQFYVRRHGARNKTLLCDNHHDSD